jgi:hypothetical protein
VAYFIVDYVEETNVYHLMDAPIFWCLISVAFLNQPVNYRRLRFVTVIVRRIVISASKPFKDWLRAEAGAPNAVT